MSTSAAVRWPDDFDLTTGHDVPSASVPAFDDAVAESVPLEIEEAGLMLVARGAEWEPAALRPTMRAFKELLELPENWDTYGAPRISIDVLVPVAKILWNLGRMRMTPELYPVNHGGVQLEWRSNLAEIELEVTPAGELAVLCHVREAEHPWERETTLGSNHASELLGTLAQLIPEA